MDYTVALACRAHDGDKEAFNELYDEYKKFISYMVGRMSKKVYGLEYEELYAVRNESFVAKIRALDIDKLKKLDRSELTTIIGNGIKWDTISAAKKVSHSLLKFSRNSIEKYWNVKKFAKEYELRKGELPSQEVVKEQLNINNDTLYMVKLVVLRNNDYENLGEEAFRISDSKDEYEEFVNQNLIRELLGTLEDKERYVIEELFFNETTQKKLANELNTYQANIKRIRDKAFEKMNESYNKWIN